MDELTGKDGYELWLRYRQAMQVLEDLLRRE
jgi:glycine cleavage system aminomethyltransferase T